MKHTNVNRYFLNDRLKEIKILSGTLSNNYAVATDLEYPEGFTKNNSMCIGRIAMNANNDKTSGEGNIGKPAPPNPCPVLGVEFTDTLIKVYPMPSSDVYGKPFKIAILKI